MKAYVLCATPRSGSTLLCALLRSSGMAGHPESWFRAESRKNYARDWGIIRDDGGFDSDEYAAAAVLAGCASGPVMGLRLMWPTMAEIETHAPLARTLDIAPGDLRFLHLQRVDLVAQAVSRLKAEVSGTWHLGFEEAAHPVEPVYDFARIRAFIDEAVADNANWRAWFARNRIEPLSLTYESLAADPVGVAGHAMAFLGLALPPGRSLEATNRPMANAVSRDWATRFRAEQVTRGS